MQHAEARNKVRSHCRHSVNLMAWSVDALQHPCGRASAVGGAAVKARTSARWRLDEVVSGPRMMEKEHYTESSRTAENAERVGCNCNMQTSGASLEDKPRKLATKHLQAKRQQQTSLRVGADLGPHPYDSRSVVTCPTRPARRELGSLGAGYSAGGETSGQPRPRSLEFASRTCALVLMRTHRAREHPRSTHTLILNPVAHPTPEHGNWYPRQRARPVCARISRDLLCGGGWWVVGACGCAGVRSRRAAAPPAARI
ncbi:hypothetical protein FA95DRAFT_768618 [Auriscalpium vulgare]|uniref:Uncharacterized protein n=1 Tax=Auriscalpium vulgare TaxID=40419 RepID=A0ACB8RC37_9AGAM|nr:hypothetical protein FA95DRAFT_768618 [Auriscalpium vulgare]